MLEDKELLSNCCGSGAIGAIVDGEGRCADCCEMAAFDDGE